MTDRELMQQALNALELWVPLSCEKEIKAIRARIAQPEQEHSAAWWKHEVSNAFANGYEKGCASVMQLEQEPVAWQWLDTATFRKHLPKTAERSAWRPLYASLPQREWVGLTDEEKYELFSNLECEVEDLFAEFARAIEAKLKEKNS